ncbi:MAG: hypothetical protein LUQ22_04315 [Methanotrichaceae archaeon]|nr:hypothetical protein [Methanotrichaceae archaeon]
MIKSIYSPDFRDILEQASSQRVQKVKVGRRNISIQIPFPSPEDWRDKWIYFIMIDRFNNPKKEPNYQWDDPNCDDFQGGTFNGISEKLNYIKSLGAGAIWITPPFKNCKFEKTYYGYGIQDFLSIDPRFGSDGTSEAAEKELGDLILKAHALDIYVIFDIVLNHVGNVFLYNKDGQLFSELDWQDIPCNVKWRDKDGNGRWPTLPAPCEGDGCVWPSELHGNEYFRRKGMGGEAGGDFGSLKEMVTDYNRYEDGYYYYAVRDVLIKAYQFAIAKYDVDGFRIDTLKYVERDFARIFGNAIREFALKIGKSNFFTFGEVWDNEDKITHYIGRYTSDEDGIIGVDAALDFPLFGKLQGTIKGLLAPDQVARIFEDRKEYQKSIISYHGEAGRFFVTFLDNHDQKERFYYQEGDKYDLQVSQGIGALFTLQGIPCMYYGTEQGLHGRGDRPEAVREALWGKPDCFNTEHSFYRAIQRLSQMRANEPALRYGRQYLREVSLNSHDFGISRELGGVLAYSRILDDQEVLTVINTSVNKEWTVDVIVDFALNFSSPSWEMLYSNVMQEQKNDLTTERIPQATVQKLNGECLFGQVRAIRVILEPMEIQILKKRESSAQ